MSRVDQALEALEGKRPSSAPTERVKLDQYAAETSVAPATEIAPAAPLGPPPPLRLPHALGPQANLAPQANIASRADKERSSKYDPDIDSRLVTKGSGAVPLEQYRRLAAVLHDIQEQQQLKTLMLTSALPSEGKTLTTVNLGLTLSESYGRRVLIIDADLRWPSVHTVFGIANESGLSEALYSPKLELPIQQLSPRLAVLTAGRPGSSPLAGLTSKRMAELIDECAKQFDWVLLDTPPVGLLPDAQPLARLTRAVVLVIAAGVTPAATVERAVAELGPECIIGTVLNRVEDRRIPQSDYYAHYRSGDKGP